MGYAEILLILFGPVILIYIVAVLFMEHRESGKSVPKALLLALVGLVMMLLIAAGGSDWPPLRP